MSDHPIPEHKYDRDRAPANLLNADVDDIRETANTAYRAGFWGIGAAIGVAVALIFICSSLGRRIHALEHPAPPASGDARSVNAP